VQQRQSDKHGPMQDDALEKEVRGLLQGDHRTRAEEALDAEPPTEEEPDVPGFSSEPPEESEESEEGPE
jgi:hypothetical protein